MVAGLIWASLVIWSGPMWKDLPLDVGVMFGLGLAGLPLMLMVARLAQRRFLDDSFIDGQPLSGPAEIDQRVLTNTTEQLVLAAAIWPMASVLSHPGAAIWLALGFLVTWLLFWVGYHLSPPLRGLGPHGLEHEGGHRGYLCAQHR